MGELSICNPFFNFSIFFLSNGLKFHFYWYCIMYRRTITTEPAVELTSDLLKEKKQRS